MDSITVNVTAEDILKGLPGSDRNCPIALAAKRCVRPWEVIVVRTGKGGGIRIGKAKYQMSEYAMQFAELYDVGVVMDKPFTFTAVKL